MCNAAFAYVLQGMQAQRDRREQRGAQHRLEDEQYVTEQERARQAAEDRMEELRRQQQVESGVEQIDNLFSAFGLQPLAPEEGFEHFNLPDQLNAETLADLLPERSFDTLPDHIRDLLNSNDIHKRTRAVVAINNMGDDAFPGIDFYRNLDFSDFGVENTANTLRDRQADTGFFDQRRQAFLDHANPQLQDQMSRQQQELAFALSRAGLGQSSTAAQRSQDLGQQANFAQQQIADRAQAQADQARQQMLGLRSELTEQLHATGDPQQALAGAGERLEAIQRPPAFGALGQVFEGAAQGIGAFEQGRRRGQSGVPLSGFFSRPSSGRGSSRVIRG